MRDEELRELERRALEGDPEAVLRLRVARGQPMFVVGDRVRVAWGYPATCGEIHLHGRRSEGEIVQAHQDGAFRVIFGPGRTGWVFGPGYIGTRLDEVTLIVPAPESVTPKGVTA